MKLCRVRRGGAEAYAVVEGDRVELLSGEPFGEIVRTGESWPLSEVELLSPAAPSKVVCVGKNYLDHAKEFNSELPAEPLIFLKPSTAVIGPEGTVEYPSFGTRVDFEGELGLVIGKKCKGVRAEDWRSVVLGFTCVNDVTERDIQFKDGQWTRGKGFDTFCPIGPWIETELDPSDLRIQTRLNGEVKQDSRTSKLIFSLGRIVEHITAFTTLLPGDVIATGTPEGVGPMKRGDTVEVEIEGIGVLRNTVK